MIYRRNEWDLYDTIAQERQRLFILENENKSIFRFKGEINSTPNRSIEFKHWAEIYIWIKDWIKLFFDFFRPGWKIKEINLLKFKETTSANIIFSIYATKQDNFKWSNIYAEFIDDLDNKYFIYWIETDHDIGNRQLAIVDESPRILIWEDYVLKKFEIWQTQEFKLHSTKTNDRQWKILTISQQPEIFQSYILDVVNLLCVNSDGISWVIASYLNIKTSEYEIGKLMANPWFIKITKVDQFKSHNNNYLYHIYEVEHTIDLHTYMSFTVKFAGMIL